MKTPLTVEQGKKQVMIRIAVVSATLLMMMSVGFAEDAPKQDAPNNECSTGDTKAAETTDCARAPKARVRRSTSTPDKPGNFFGNGYDARIMAPTFMPGSAR
jgi:hypothetical protein